MRKHGLIKSDCLGLLEAHDTAKLPRERLQLVAHPALVLCDGDVFGPNGADVADVAVQPACPEAQKANGQQTHDDPEEIPVFAFGRHVEGALSASKFVPRGASQMDRAQRGQVQVAARGLTIC